MFIKRYLITTPVINLLMNNNGFASIFASVIASPIPDNHSSAVSGLSAILSRWRVPDAAYRIKPEQLCDVPLPFIACFNNQTYGVVTRFDNEVISVTDELMTCQLISSKEFASKWIGVVLIGKNDAVQGSTPVVMPNFSELKLAKIINTFTKMVFIAACRQFTVQDFERELFNYMVRPVSDENFLKFISEYKRQLNNKDKPVFEDYFFVKEDAKNRHCRIDLQDINYVEGNANYIVIHTTTGSKITYLTLHEMEASLPADKFTRISKSFIVADEKVRSIHGNTLSLDGVDRSFDIGRVYKDSFFLKFNRKFAVTWRGKSQ